MDVAQIAEDALAQINADGTKKVERILLSPQSSGITTRSTINAEKVLNFCANNYLGLADDQRLVEAAKTALDDYGFGVASVRFICGAQDIHKELEERTASFLGMEDCIVFPSCFDANSGIFEALLTDEDAVISDSLNHASIIDGIRLSKAQRYRYQNNDMNDLEEKLVSSQDCRSRLIVTDGVFSMDGMIANLPAICELAEQYDASVMVDDSHAVGFLGKRGAGTPELFGVEGKIQILTGTYGNALGGASGGYIAGSRAVIELLRQRARPYLFSNALAPAICAASIKAIDIAEYDSRQKRSQLEKNSKRFRSDMTNAGFELLGNNHPIIPIMIGDAALASKFADTLLIRGIYAVAFSYPVVPKGQARIRTQMSANHCFEQIDRAVNIFSEVGRKFGIIS